MTESPSPPTTRVAGTDTFEELVDALVALELPALPSDRVDATVGFCGQRFQVMAGPVRLALQLSLTGLAAPIKMFGPRRTMRWLTATRLPFVGDIARAMRYLVVSYVWERWPDTAPDGAPAADDTDTNDAHVAAIGVTTLDTKVGT